MGTDSTTDRAEFVQQLYDLAAFIEKRTDLPVPDQCKVQYSAIRGTMAEQRAVVVAAATALGVELIEWDSGDGNQAASARYRDPSGFMYVVHADTRYGSDYRREPELAVADLPFIPPFAAAQRAIEGPPMPVGGPSHPDGPAIPGLGGESVEDSEPALCDECETTGKNCLAHGGLPYQYTGMSDHVVKAIGDLLEHDAKLRGYEDPAVPNPIGCCDGTGVIDNSDGPVRCPCDVCPAAVTE
jgi:hypothetical protein